MTRRIGVTEAAKVVAPRSVTLAPDCEHVAFVIAPGVPSVWVARSEPSSVWQLASHADSPCWAHDSRHLALSAPPTGDLPGKIVIAHITDDTTRELTVPGVSLTAPCWLTGTDELLAIGQPFPEPAAEPTGIVSYPAQTSRSTLLQLTRDGAARAIGGLANWHIWCYALSPRGQRAAVLVSESAELDEIFGGLARVAVLDLTSETLTVLDTARDTYRAHSLTPTSLTWLDESNLWYLASNPGAQYRAANIFTADVHAENGQWTPRIAYADEIGTPLGLSEANGSLVVVRQCGITTGLWRLASGDLTEIRVPVVGEGRGSLNNELAESPPGPFASRFSGTRFALTWSGSASAPEIWAGSLESDLAPVQITAFNTELAERAHGNQGRVSWEAPDGMHIEGVLIEPVDASPPPWPAVVLIHGGPAQIWDDGHHANVFMWGQVLAGHGLAVLMPNPRGSLGYGNDFQEANVDDWMGHDCTDILSGVDLLVAKGVLAPEQLGIGGSSYGGYATAWIITQTDRFRAAVVAAGVSNLASQVLTTDVRAWGRSYLPSWSLDQMWQRSPAPYLDRVKTPTLVLHGDADTRVPVSQAWQLFNGLRESDVEARLVLYSGETHDLANPNYYADYLQRIVDWYVERLL